MKIAVDRNMPLAPQAFATLGTVTVIDGRTLTAADLRDTDLLAIRSTTKVDANLLDQTSVRFVGTATIGTDHMDLPLLESRGIHWTYAPGCNARSVAEYLTAALLALSQRHAFSLAGKTLGVIGVGNVGSLVVQQARALGMQVLQNDPPRQRRLAPSQPDPFTSLDTLLAQADFVTLHVPLSRSGPDPTFHMANQAFFQKMRPGAFFLNAARGGIMDTQALLDALTQNQIRGAVLDTWEAEPAISPRLLDLVEIGTPHIAGHSYEGKLGGTIMVYQEACRFTGSPPTFDPTPHLPPPTVPSLTAQPDNAPEALLHRLVTTIYDISCDDQRLRQALRSNPADGFDLLRRNYPIRREFRFTTVDTQQIPQTDRARIAAIGFQTSPPLEE